MKYLLPWKEITDPYSHWIRLDNEKNLIACIEPTARYKKFNYVLTIDINIINLDESRYFKTLDEAKKFTDQKLIEYGYKLVDNKYQTLI